MINLTKIKLLLELFIFRIYIIKNKFLFKFKSFNHIRPIIVNLFFLSQKVSLLKKNEDMMQFLLNYYYQEHKNVLIINNFQDLIN